MSGTDANDPDPEIDRINLRISRSFLEVVDEAWRERGFNSRSEFIRYTLRDAAENPTFDRDELIALLQAEVDIDAGRTMDAETAREQFGTDEDG